MNFAEYWTYSSWSRRLEDVLKTSSEDEDERRLQDVFKTSSSRQMFAGMTSSTVKIKLFYIKKAFTYLILFRVVSFWNQMLNKSFHAFVLTFLLKIDLLLPLGFKVINVKKKLYLRLKNLKHSSKYCNVNVFQLINFCDCRIPNQKFIFVRTYLCKK